MLKICKRWTMAGLVAIAAAATGCGGGGSEPAASPFQVQATSTDASQPAVTLASGQEQAITVAPGTQVTLSSVADTRWSVAASSASYQVESFSLTQKVLTVSSIPGGEVTVELRSDSDTTARAVLHIGVTPRQFNPAVLRVGELRTWRQSYVYVGGDTFTRDLNSRVSSLDSDGGFSLQSLSDNGTVLNVSTYNADWAQTSILVSSTGLQCTQSQKSSASRFPLVVGQSRTFSADESCTDGFIATTSGTEQVAGYTSVTSALGTYDALKLVTTSTSTAFDPSAPGGSSETSSTVDTCYWAVDLGRTILCDSVWTFPGTPASGSIRTLRQELTSLTP